MLTQIKAGVLLSYLTLFLGNIISFLYTPFMLRLMGQSEYGLYTLSTSIIGCLGIMEFGLGNALIRNVAEYRALNDRESQYRLYGMYFIIYLLIAILVTIAGSYLVLNIGAFFARTLSQDEIMKAKIIMSLMVLNLALSLPFSVFSSAILAYERFVFSKTIQLLYTLLNPMIMIPLLLMGYRSVEMAIVGTCFAILSIVVNTYYCFKVLKIKLYFAKFDRVILKKNMTYAFSVFLAIIFDKVFWSSNPFVLGLTSGTISVAIYSIGASFSTYYMSLGGAITGLFLPKITAMVTLNSSNREVSNIFIKTGRIMFIILSYFFIGFVLFGQAFIIYWAGESYASSYPIAIALMLPLTVAIIQSLGLSILQAKNKQVFRNIIYSCIAILNFVASYYIAPIWGALGCALVSAVVQLIGPIIIMNYYYYKKIQLDIPAFWKEIGKIALPVLITFFIGLVLNVVLANGIWALVPKIILFSIAFIALIWSLGLNCYEKKILTEMLTRLRIINSA